MKTHASSTDLVNVTSFGTTSPANASSVSLTIYGTVPSFKNRRRILKNRRSGKPFSAKSDDAVKWMEDFVLQCPMECRNLRLGSLTTPLRAIITVFHPDMRSDLDCSGIYDGLQAAGVIANDRFIREQHHWAEIDKKSPRAEIVIEAI